MIELLYMTVVLRKKYAIKPMPSKTIAEKQTALSVFLRGMGFAESETIVSPAAAMITVIGAAISHAKTQISWIVRKDSSFPQYLNTHARTSIAANKAVITADAIVTASGSFDPFPIISRSFYTLNLNTTMSPSCMT